MEDFLSPDLVAIPDHLLAVATSQPVAPPATIGIFISIIVHSSVAKSVWSGSSPFYMEKIQPQKFLWNSGTMLRKARSSRSFKPTGNCNKVFKDRRPVAATVFFPWNYPCIQLYGVEEEVTLIYSDGSARSEAVDQKGSRWSHRGKSTFTSCWRHFSGMCVRVIFFNYSKKLSEGHRSYKI